MIAGVVFDFVGDITGFTPYMDAPINFTEAGRELDKVEGNIIIRDPEIAREISGLAIKGMIKNMIKFAEAAVVSEEMSVVACGEFQAMAKGLIPCLLSGNEERISGAIRALREHMLAIITIYNKIYYAESVDRTYMSVAVNEDSLSFTKLAMLFIAYKFLNLHSDAREAYLKDERKRQRAECFDYSNVDNKEWANELEQHKNLQKNEMNNSYK